MKRQKKQIFFIQTSCFALEMISGCFYVIIFLVHGAAVITILYCLMSSILLSISVIDWYLYEIPLQMNFFLGILGVIRMFLDFENIEIYLFGFFCVSGILELSYLLTKGRAIGGGDIKMMAAGGLFLGYQRILMAFFLGCLFGFIIHFIRMRVSRVSSTMAMAPYLSVGMLIVTFFG